MARRTRELPMGRGDLEEARCPRRSDGMMTRVRGAMMVPDSARRLGSAQVPGGFTTVQNDDLLEGASGGSCCGSRRQCPLRRDLLLLDASGCSRATCDSHLVLERTVVSGTSPARRLHGYDLVLPIAAREQHRVGRSVRNSRPVDPACEGPNEWRFVVATLLARPCSWPQWPDVGRIDPRLSEKAGIRRRPAVNSKKPRLAMARIMERKSEVIYCQTDVECPARHKCAPTLAGGFCLQTCDADEDCPRGSDCACARKRGSRIAGCAIDRLGFVRPGADLISMSYGPAIPPAFYYIWTHSPKLRENG